MAAVAPSGPKITLAQILRTDGGPGLESPYDEHTFEKYLIDEHSAENIEFWKAAQVYKNASEKYYPNQGKGALTKAFEKGGSLHCLLKSSLTKIGSVASLSLGRKDAAELSPTGGPDATAATKEEIPEKTSPVGERSSEIAFVLTPEKKEEFKAALNDIINSFLTPGSEKEININDVIRKKVMKEFSAGNYSPDILRSPSDKAFEMMRVQSLPRFLVFINEPAAIVKVRSLGAALRNEQQQAEERKNNSKTDETHKGNSDAKKSGMWKKLFGGKKDKNRSIAEGETS